jgi:hypothetical protein
MHALFMHCLQELFFSLLSPLTYWLSERREERKRAYVNS